MSLSLYCSCGAQWHGDLVRSDAAVRHRWLKHPELTHEQFVASGKAPCNYLQCRQAREAAAAAERRLMKSAAMKAAMADPEVRARKSGRNHWNWGRQHSPSTKAKMSEAYRRRRAARGGAGES